MLYAELMTIMDDNKDKDIHKLKDKHSHNHSQNHSEEEDDIFWSTYAALEQKKVTKWEARLWHWAWAKNKNTEAKDGEAEKKRFVQTFSFHVKFPLFLETLIKGE